MVHPRNIGVQNALETFGLEKTSIDWGSVGHWIKNTAIGQPGEFWKQLRSGSLLSKPDGLWRKAFVPHDDQGHFNPLMAALMYGFPAYGLYQASQTSPEYRGSAIGNVVGGAMGGFLGSPLGMVGSTIGSNLLGRAGQMVGANFDAAKTRRRRATPPELPEAHPSIRKLLPTLSEQMSEVTGTPAR